MIRKKWIDKAAVAAILFALFLSMALTYFPQVFALESKGISMKYETELFDKNQVMTINILMSDTDWEEMLANAVAEEYYHCDVVINGVTYKNVGIRPKGNTSLSQVASDDTTDRYSFKLEFDHYDSSQTCMGLDKLVLNNMISDATCRKEYISYDMMKYLGVETSLYAYADVSVNGETWGLYFALEAMEESYAERVFGASYGELYKPETLGMGMGGAGIQNGTDLAYIDDEIDSYSAIFDAAVFNPSKEDKKKVMEALKNLNEGTNLEDYIDIDAMLRYIASNTFVINDDSYFGNMLHNYYLYEENGKISMLPWDYNLAFGGFQSHNASAAVNRGIDDVVSGSLEERPIIAKLLEVEEYQEQYYKYLDQLISEYFESGYFEELMDCLDILLDSYIQNDPTAFFTYEEYTKANQMLRLFCEKRAESVRSQLNGTLAKTANAQTSETKVDTTEIDLSVMGTQGGGMAGGRGGQTEGMQRNSGENNEMSGNRGQFPGGNIDMQPNVGQFSEGNMEMPQNMGQPPEENMEMPQDMEQSAESAETWRGMRGNREGFGQNMQEGGFPGGFPGTMQEQQNKQTDAWIWLGISALTMAAGLLFIRLYPRSRY